MFVWYALLLYLVQEAGALSADDHRRVSAFRSCCYPRWLPWPGCSGSGQGIRSGNFPLTLMSLALFIWIIAANSHIVKAALEWSMPPSVALVILQTLVGRAPGARPVSNPNPSSD